MTARFVLVGSLVLALTAIGCGGRRTRVVSAPPPQTQVVVAQPMGGPAAAVVLGRDLMCNIGGAVLQVAAPGQLYVNGEFVGTITADGGFYNVDGVEIGRLYGNGRMMFGGTMQDAGIDGASISAPAGTIAMIDGNGYLHVPGGAPPAPVAGLTVDTVQTFLFAFSMYAGLLDTAQRMGY